MVALFGFPWVNLRVTLSMTAHAEITQKFKMAAVKPETHVSEYLRFHRC